MSRFLVTGANGYLGLHIVKELSRQGFEAHALVRPTADRERLGEILDADRIHSFDGSAPSLDAAVRSSRPQGVLHTAGIMRAETAVSDIDAMLDANVRFGLCLLQAAVLHGVETFVSAGTFSQFDETGAECPNSFYGASKSAYQRLAKVLSTGSPVRHVTLILGDVYGARDWRPKILPLVLQALAEKRRLDMTAGEQKLDLVHVEDAARAFLHVAMNGELNEEAYSVCSGVPQTLRQYVERFIAIAGEYGFDGHETINWGALPYREHQLSQPAFPFPAPPDWRPSVSLDDGFRQIFEKAAP